MGFENLKERTMKLALKIVRLAPTIGKTVSGEVIGKQVIRSGTSVAANYRAACKAKSQKDFIYKLSIVEEECDETNFWFTLLWESQILQTEDVRFLIEETNELSKIFGASRITAKKNLKQPIPYKQPVPNGE